MLKQTFGIGCLAATLLIGCDSDSGTKGAGPDAGNATDAMQADVAPAIATMAEICGDDGLFVTVINKFAECLPEYETFAGGFPDAAAISKICNEGNQPYLDDGTLALGPASILATCQAAIEAADCLDFDFDFLSACDGLLFGQVEASGACDSHDMCLEGLFCDQSGELDCGFCAAVKPAGNSCTEGKECQDGVCVEGVCSGDGLEGSECVDDDHCRGRLTCDAVTLVCTNPDSYQLGDSCVEFDGQCGVPFSGMYCNSVAVGGAKCENLRGLGEDCDQNAGQLCDFFQALSCDQGDTQTCIAAVAQADGEICDILAGTTCLGGSLCLSDQGSEGVCTALKGDGEACVEDEEVGCSIFLECVGGFCQAGNYSGLCSVP